MEYFKIPRDVLTMCVGKSTYARCGIIVNVTPFEPEWEGFVTLEIPIPRRCRRVSTLTRDCARSCSSSRMSSCETSYKDKKGKYQGQQGIVLPKV